MSKCDFSAWVFSCKSVAYFQNTFYQKHVWAAASEDFLIFSKRKKQEGKESTDHNQQLEISMKLEENMGIHTQFFILRDFP